MRGSRLGFSITLFLAIAAFLTLYMTFIRPWHMRWGATDAEIQTPLPGDYTIPADTVVSTRAVTIHAPREVVWSWLVQLGQGRGGYYSFEWLENLFAADMHNAEQIVPGLQHLAVGDHISFQKDGPFAVVGEVKPGQRLVLEGGWAWYLYDEPSNDGDSNATRLVVRYASFPIGNAAARLFYYPIFEPVHFIMEQGMMLGIKARAERSPETTAVSVVR